MSKASQRAMSRRKKNPALDIFDLAISAANAKDAVAREKSAAAISAEFIKNAFATFKRKEGSRFNEEAHKALDEAMMRDIKPLLEEIKAAMTGSEMAYLDPEGFENHPELPFLSGTAIFSSADPSVPLMTSPMPYSMVKSEIASFDPSMNICDILMIHCDHYSSSGFPVDLAVWVTSTDTLPWCLMVHAVHQAGAKATYVLRGDVWTKGPPYLDPFEDTQEAPPAVSHGAPGQDAVETYNTHVKQLLQEANVADSEESFQKIDEYCAEINHKLQLGTHHGLVQSALRNVQNQSVARQYEAELINMRKLHALAERTARKSKARIAELESETARLRASLAKKEATAQQAKQLQQTKASADRSSSISERMGGFFG